MSEQPTAELTNGSGPERLRPNRPCWNPYSSRVLTGLLCVMAYALMGRSTLLIFIATCCTVAKMLSRRRVAVVHVQHVRARTNSGGCRGVGGVG